MQWRLGHRMRIATAAYYLRDSVAEIGVRRTVFRTVRHVYRLAFPEKVSIHPFDVRHGVDTSGLIPKIALASGHENDRFVTAYLGTAPSLFRDVMEHWIESLKDTPYTCSDFALMDIGCGKGRVVMMASELPFRQVVGVELSPLLAAIGRKNLEIWGTRVHACKDASLLNADAVACPFPDCPLLIYMFNPFKAPVVQLLLERLEALVLERFRIVDIVYARAEHADLFDRIADMRLLYEGEAIYTAEDTAADVFKTQVMDYRIYRLAAGAKP